MSFDAQQEEQKALTLLNQGKVELALSSFKQILRYDPKNRRIKKQVADLQMRLGQTKEATDLYLSIVETMVKENQHKQAIPLYRDLIKLRPKDYEMHLEIAECMLKSNMNNDAISHFKKAVEMTQRQKPDKAQEIQKKVIALQPGELQERRKLAELLEAANWLDKASDEWKRFAELNRRLGNPKEAARSMEQAVRIRENWESRLDAAQARLDAKEPRRSLEHVHQIYKEYYLEPRVLALLGAGLQSVHRLDQARQLWLLAAKKYEDEQRKLAAYEQAIECGMDPNDIGEAYTKLAYRLHGKNMRLTDCDWASIQSAVDGRFAVKARLLLQYKQYKLALQAIREAEGMEKRPSIFATLVECLIATEQIDDAIVLLQEFKSKDAQIQQDVQQRLAGISKEEVEEVIDDEFLDDELGDDFASIDSDVSVSSVEQPRHVQPAMPSADALMQQARLARSKGNNEEAMALLNAVLEIDIMHSEAIECLGSWAMDGSAQVETPSFATQNFAPQSFATPNSSTTDFGFGNLGNTPFAQNNAISTNPSPVSNLASASAAVLEIRKRMLVGLYDEAAMLAEQDGSVDAKMLLIGIRIAQGNYRVAANLAQDTVDSINEQHPQYLPLMWEVATAYSLQQKVRSVQRTLDEMQDVDPTYRAEEIQLWREALELIS